ncbi:20194_t:CDS:2, partial [Racocetra fulgida]
MQRTIDESGDLLILRKEKKYKYTPAYKLTAHLSQELFAYNRIDN